MLRVDFSNSGNNRHHSNLYKHKQQYANKTLHYFSAPLDITINMINPVCRNLNIPECSRLLTFGAKNGQRFTGTGLIEWENTDKALTALASLNHRMIEGNGQQFQLKLCFASSGRDARLMRPGDICEIASDEYK